MTKHFSHRLGAGLLAGVVVVGGTTEAVAAKGTNAHANRTVVAGLVSNLSAAGFTLTRTTRATTTSAATVKVTQVTLNGTVKERATKGTTGALSNGEFALVIGQKSTAGVTATRVVYATTAKGLRHAMRRLTRVRAGTVSAASPSSVTITTRAGKSFTFTLTSATTFRVNKQRTTSSPVFTPGEKVRVHFRRDRVTKSLVALVIGVPVQK